MSDDIEKEERVKRPEPEEIGADGLPIKICDTVYLESFGRPFTVVGFDGAYLKDADGGHLRADCATHTTPDTQEQIDEERAEEGRAALAGMSDAASSDAVRAASEAERAMVERTCSEAARPARIGYGIGAGEDHDADDSEHDEFGKKGCMKTLYGPVTGFYREVA